MSSLAASTSSSAADELAHVRGAALEPRPIVRRAEDSTDGYGLGATDLGAWLQRRQPLAERRSAGRERKAATDVRLAVCMPQVPFERGGTEIFADGLVGALRERGHAAELVTVPYKWYPGEQVLTQAFLWRLLDLEEANGAPIDAVIATKFPSYAVRHPRKVVWLLHQFRQAWDLDRTELGQFSESAEDRTLRRKVLEFDRVALGEARKIFTTSSIVAGRLRDSTGLDAEVLAPPPAPLDFHCDGYEDFILSVNRLDRAKRIDLLIEAAAQTTGLRIVIAGDGPDRERLEELAHARGLDGRVTFAGRVSDVELADLYARCLGVYYAPVDEDYGLVPYEAFLSQKPVVTTTDAGGPLDIVHDRETGLVVAPAVDELARACAWLRDHPDEAQALGRAGRDIARAVTWDGCIDRLLAAVA